MFRARSGTARPSALEIEATLVGGLLLLAYAELGISAVRAITAWL